MMNRTMFAATIVVGSLLVPSLSVAQPTDAIIGYEVRFYQGGTVPVSTYPYAVADVIDDEVFEANYSLI